jgi:hypothetical protein
MPQFGKKINDQRVVSTDENVRKKKFTIYLSSIVTAAQSSGWSLSG